MNCIVSAPTFSELHADVIFSIFACCDIVTVISIAQTCKSLHDLAFSKTTWLALVEDLRQRSILDASCTPDLQDLTTEELIGIVKPLETGPSSWGAALAPNISKEISLQAARKRANEAEEVRRARTGVAGLALESRLLQAPHIDRRRARPLLIHRRPEVYILPTHVESVRVLVVAQARCGRGLCAKESWHYGAPWLCFQALRAIDVALRRVCVGWR
ncbi:hypothetical protein B0H14DRAFT_3464002 [Mycena olivaceomarginata]|nr:hypothetical protein B0H14DRAFT_3464002 [Mycena olivaceomarginata]